MNTKLVKLPAKGSKKIKNLARLYANCVFSDISNSLLIITNADRRNVEDRFMQMIEELRMDGRVRP